MKILKFNESLSSLKEKLKQDLYNIYNLKLGSPKYPSNLRYEMMQTLISHIANVSHCNIKFADANFEYSIEHTDMTIDTFDELCEKTINFDGLL